MWDTAVRTMAYHLSIAAAETGGTPPQPGAPTSPLGNMWFFLIAMVAIMWFFMLRPQQKREKERREMLASLSKGDKVLTTGGILGTIVGLAEKTVVLRISEDPAVKIECVRGAISRKVTEDRSRGDRDDDR